MPVQTIPATARRYAAQQRRERIAATKAIMRAWRRMGGDLDASFMRLLPTMLAVTDQAQTRVAERAQTYIPDVLDATGQTDAIEPAGVTRVSPLVGVTGDGRGVDTLLYGAVTHTKDAIGGGLAEGAALRSGGVWLTTAVGTLLSDTGRQSEALGTGVRPVGGYVRMLEGASCSRCVVLAGKWFRTNTGFQRHPRCDCRHIPASESVAGDMTVDSRAYFDQLTPEQQDATFTQAGAEAIRNGADINQVVNARRGMSVSQGRAITTEGTTSRGRAYQRLKAGGTQQELAGTAVRITRNGPQMRVVTRTRARTPRLMPETIARTAKSREDYLRLLRAHGYLL